MLGSAQGEPTKEQKEFFENEDCPDSLRELLQVP